MSLLQTGRQVLGEATDAAGRTLGTASETTRTVRARFQRATGRVRGVFATTERRIDAIGGTRIPALPVGGRTATVVLSAATIAAVAVLAFDVELPYAAGLFAGIVAGDLLVKVVVLAAATVAGFLAWGQAQATETATRTRSAVAAGVSAAVATALAIVFGIVDPLAMVVGVFGDTLLGVATAGFAAVTGFVSAASARATGASNRGMAAAGVAGAGAAGLFGALAFPAVAVSAAALLSVALDNPFPVALVGAAFVFFVTDPFTESAGFTSTLVSMIRATVLALLAFSAIVAFGPTIGPVFAVVPAAVPGGEP